MTAALIEGTPPPIPAERARSLNRWNLILAILHAIQGVAILSISLGQAKLVTFPVTVSYLTFDAATQSLDPAQRQVWDLPIGPAVAAFFFLSAIAHFLVALPLRSRYEGWLARGQNPMRWLEYALSSSVMIVVIASLTGIQDAGALIAIFGVNAAMNLFGWSMESANEGRSKVQWNHYIFGCVAGIVPWVVIFLAIWASASEPGAEPTPAFVIAIFISLFVSFNIFAINMILQYRKVGKWADYLHGERAYMIFSLIAKTILAWQVFSGTLAPVN